MYTKVVASSLWRPHSSRPTPPPSAPALGPFQPAAAAGLFYEFHIGTTFTGSFILQGASSADTFQGMVFQLDKDELGSVVALNEDIDTAGWNIPAAADYRLTMDADTDGRFIGGHIRCVAITDAIWLLNGHVFGDGTVSHSFS